MSNKKQATHMENSSSHGAVPWASLLEGRMGWAEWTRPGCTLSVLGKCMFLLQAAEHGCRGCLLFSILEIWTHSYSEMLECPALIGCLFGSLTLFYPFLQIRLNSRGLIYSVGLLLASVFVTVGLQLSPYS